MDDPKASLAILPPRHESYLLEAQRLQALYEPQIHLIIAFEAEYIRPDLGPHVHRLASNPLVDYFIGSVHHVHSIPIDFDKATYQRAVEASAGSEERLYGDYYDLQLLMLRDLKPRVVGHFDLIRLMSDEPGRDVREWKGVWEKIVRNLEVVKETGGWLECNSAALRKGLEEPYPCRAIAEVSQPTACLRFPYTNSVIGVAQDGGQVHHVGRQPRHRTGRDELLPRADVPREHGRERGLDV